MKFDAKYFRDMKRSFGDQKKLSWEEKVAMAERAAVIIGNNPNYLPAYFYDVGIELEGYVNAIAAAVNEPALNTYLALNMASNGAAHREARTIAFNLGVMDCLSSKAQPALAAHEVGHFLHDTGIAKMIYKVARDLFWPLVTCTSIIAGMTGAWAESFCALAALYVTAFISMGKSIGQWEKEADEFAVTVVGKEKLIALYTEVARIKEEQPELYFDYYNMGPDYMLAKKIFYPTPQEKISYVQSLEDQEPRISYQLT